LLVAAAAAVFTYLAMWALLFFVCLFIASNGRSFLPSPSSWTLRAVYLAVAILVGILAFRRGWRWDLSPRRAAVPAGLALAAVLVVSGSTHAYGVSREHHYLRYLPPGMSREAGLAYGHQACDWLAAQPWGRPPGPDHLPRAREVTANHLVYLPHHVRWHRANSTDRLTVFYLDHLDAQQPGPLTDSERQQASVTATAWYELCPFQQWVHRPVGGSHPGGD
jgi:hypothetical protein